MAKPKDCSICFDSIKFEELARIDSCEHVFHFDCIDKWFSLKHNQCPYCKTVATNISFDFDKSGLCSKSNRQVQAPPEEEPELDAIFAMARVIRGVFLTRLSTQPFFELSNKLTARSVQVTCVNGQTSELGPGQTMQLIEPHPDTRVSISGGQGASELLGPSINFVIRSMAEEEEAISQEHQEELWEAQNLHLTPAGRVVARRNRSF